ncbi:MAG: LL-diaminopimelate aminotransferase [Candidatus Omnitrophica bacterium]|nr:LL-diaminopimelate aminotransferase [Candidatus Omnitrophota bacterium]
MKIEQAERLKQLPPYLFQEIDKAKNKAIQEGRPVISLGVGDPDTPTPDFIVKKLQEAVLDPSTHRYALDQGLKALRVAMANWYERRFGIAMDPETEILPLMGSKDGVAHIPLAFVNPGDTVLASNPGYPPYISGGIFVGAKVHMMPLLKKNGFLPDLSKIKAVALKRARLMHINYPNNPTGAVCDLKFYEDVRDFAQKHNIIVCSDAAYSEVASEGTRVYSYFEADRKKETGIEFHSLSKTFNMTGWRIGMAVGNKDVLAGLAKVKSNIDSGIFTAVQYAGIEALNRADEVKSRMNAIYNARRDAICDGLNRIGWKVEKPKGAFYVWIPVLKGYDSISMAKAMLERADIVVTPGSGFGKYGEGYIRMALTVDVPKFDEAVARIKKAFF